MLWGSCATVRPDLDVREVSVYLTSAFEGSVMMGKLYNDNDYVRLYYQQLETIWIAA